MEELPSCRDVKFFCRFFMTEDGHNIKKGGCSHVNLIELVTDVFKNYKNLHDSPLHVGEVMNLWTFLTATENFTNSELIALNKVEDPQLKEKMVDLIENYHKPITTEIKQLLLNEGVELPQPPSEKPQMKIDVPPGGKMTDEEVANLVVFNLVWAMQFCARGLTEAIRPDVGQLYVSAIVQKAGFSLTLKQLLMEKGWLKFPPPYRTEGTKKG